MLIWIFGGLSSVSNIKVHSAAEEAGRAIGSAIGVAELLWLWVIGDMILGILVLVSRGDKITVEKIGGSSAFKAESSFGDLGKADDLIAQFKAERERADISPTISSSPQTGGVPAAFGKRR